MKKALAQKVGEVRYLQPGPEGPAGPAGPIGPSGPAGAQGEVGPFYYPAGAWDPMVNYLRTSIACPYVIYNKLYYYRKTLGPCIGKNPQEDVAGPQLYWDVMTSQKAAFYEIVFVEKFSKLASFIFNGDFMMSQQGLLKGAPSSNFEQFKPDMSGFIPNILMNALTGYARFNNVDIEGNIKAGSIGSFKIDKGLKNTDKNGVIVEDAYINLTRPSKSTLSINEKNCVGLLDITLNGGNQFATETAVNIKCFGDNCECLHLISNAGENNYTIKSFGDALLEARAGEKVQVKGLCLNTKHITSSTSLYSSDDIIRFTSNGSYTITLPSAKVYAGKVYKCKVTAGSWTFKSTEGGIIQPSSHVISSSYTISSTIAFEIVSDSVDWCFFFCG